MSRGRQLGTAATVVALAACAQLAGLEESTPEQRFAISSLEMKLPDAPCGSHAEQELGLENTTDLPIDYDVTIPEGSAYVLRRPDGIENLSLRARIEPHSSARIPIVLTTSRPGLFGTDVFVNAQGKSQIVRVEAKVTGSDLLFTPNLVDFGQVRKEAPTPDQEVEVENSGNEPTTIKSFASEAASTDFAMIAGDVVVGPGEKKKVPARFASGPAGAPASASFSPVTDKPTCGPLPKLTLKGVRVNQDVVVSPLTAGFGDVNCNAGGDGRVITVSNYGPTPVPFVVTLPADARFGANPTSATVPAASGAEPGTRTITITRNPVGADLVDINQGITVAIQGTVPSTPEVRASFRVVGALLEVSPGQLDNVNGGGSPFQVRNYGTRGITVFHGVSNGAFTVTGSSSLNPGETKNPVVRLTTTVVGNHGTDVSTIYPGDPFFYGGPLCRPAATIRANGTVKPPPTGT